MLDANEALDLQEEAEYLARQEAEKKAKEKEPRR
jgi:hypothetical protein